MLNTNTCANPVHATQYYLISAPQKLHRNPRGASKERGQPPTTQRYMKLRDNGTTTSTQAHSANPNETSMACMAWRTGGATRYHAMPCHAMP